MEKLKSLLGNLRVGCIVFVENDFYFSTDVERLLGSFVKLDKIKTNRILKKLDLLGYSDLAIEINDFIAGYVDITTHDHLLESALMPTNIREYLRNIGREDLLSPTFLSKLDATLSQGEVLKELFLRYGINLMGNQAYTSLLRLVDESPNLYSLYYRSVPTPAELEEFMLELKFGVEHTNSKFYLAVIDKMLGHGDTGEQGKSFIKDQLIKINAANKLNFIGFLFSSQALDISPRSYEDYFLREISKSDIKLMERMIDCLAQAAYAQVFHSLKGYYDEASKYAFDKVLFNQKNIKYIISKSHSEGIPPYDACRYWFDLTVQRQFDIEQVKNYKFIGGLMSFFNNDFLSDHPNIHEIGNELMALNSYELFDYDLNSRYASIAPGDIWMINNRYFILLGQLCDTLMRERDNLRNSKVAELLEIKLSNYEESANKDKFYVKVDDGGKKTINIEHFLEPITQQYRLIKIDISAKNTYYADFTLLDLATFNHDGVCAIHSSDPLGAQIKNILPKTKGEYFKDLQDIYKPIIDSGIHLNQELKSISSSIDFPYHVFTLEDGVIRHNAGRVARLKGRFYDALYNNYINYKSRIDLNLIDNSPESVTQITLSCGFISVEESFVEVPNFSLWKKKNSFFIRRDELIDRIPRNFHALVNRCQENLEINDTEKYKLDYDQNLGILKLQMKFLITNGKYHSKPEFSYSSLFGKLREADNPNFRIIGSEEDLSFYVDESGYAKRILTYDDLSKGVIVYAMDRKVKIVDGVVQEEKISNE